MANDQQIEKLLNDMRLAIDHNKFQPINRGKNLKTLAQLGLTWTDARDEIYSLQRQHFFKGPVVDRDYPSTDLFWVFKKKIDIETIYIKFKVLYQKNGELKLVSFHIDEVP